MPTAIAAPAIATTATAPTIHLSRDRAAALRSICDHPPRVVVGPGGAMRAEPTIADGVRPEASGFDGVGCATVV
ncbi:MAG TPA: hypothetical protein VGM56_17300, partial [Byssovorax sp.]